MIDYLTSFYITMGFTLFAGGLGYYVGERTWQGVQNDINNVKLDIERLKGAVAKKSS